MRHLNISIIFFFSLYFVHMASTNTNLPGPITPEMKEHLTNLLDSEHKDTLSNKKTFETHKALSILGTDLHTKFTSEEHKICNKEETTGEPTNPISLEENYYLMELRKLYGCPQPLHKTVIDEAEKALKSAISSIDSYFYSTYILLNALEFNPGFKQGNVGQNAIKLLENIGNKVNPEKTAADNLWDSERITAILVGVNKNASAEVQDKNLPLLKKLAANLGKGKKVRKDHLQFFEGTKSSSILTAKMMLTSLLIPELVLTDHQGKLSSSILYLTTKLYSINTCEEIYYVLLALEGHKEIPFVKLNAYKLKLGAKELKFTMSDMFNTPSFTPVKPESIKITKDMSEKMTGLNQLADGNTFSIPIGELNSGFHTLGFRITATVNGQRWVVKYNKYILITADVQFDKIEIQTLPIKPKSLKIAKYPETINEVKKVVGNTKIKYILKLTGEYKELTSANAMIKLKHTNHKELDYYFFGMQSKDKTGFEITIDFSPAGMMTENINGIYELTAIVGGTHLEKPITWQLQKLDIERNGGSYTYTPPSTNPVTQDEIINYFVPEREVAPTYISYPTTIIVAIMFIIFFKYLMSYTNLGNFPQSGKFFSILFILMMIGTIFFLVYFWYGLRLLTILPWLLLLILAFMIVGNKALNSLDTLDIPEVKTDISAE